MECGIIAEHYPDLQMVSFGPDIQGAHAPGERVKMDTVEKCWKLLVTALESVDNEVNPEIIGTNDPNSVLINQ